MAYPDDLFHPEHVDEQVEYMVHIQESQLLSTTPGALTITTLKSIYEEDEDILQRAWARLSILHEASDTSEGPGHTSSEPFEKRENDMEHTTWSSVADDTTIISSPTALRSSRSVSQPRQRRWQVIGALVAAVLVILINIIAWKIILPSSSPTTRSAGGGPIQKTDTCGPRSAGTQTGISQKNTANMQCYQSRMYSLLYPQGWQGQQGTQGDGDGANFNNAAIGASLVISDAAGGNCLLPATIADTTLPISSNGIKVKNFHSITIPQTTAVGGVIWEQRAGIGEVTHDGKTVEIKQVVLVTTFPGSCNRAIILHYEAPTASFDQINTSAFQAMLHSFTFVKDEKNKS